MLRRPRIAVRTTRASIADRVARAIGLAVAVCTAVALLLATDASAGDRLQPRCGIAPAWLLEPAADVVLDDESVRFEWEEGIFILQYALGVAKDRESLLAPPDGDRGPGGDVFSLPPTTDRSVTVAGIPIDGRHVHVALWSREGCAGEWWAESFTLVTDGFVLGDASGDGLLTASDALLVLKMAVRLRPSLRPVADVDGDGEVRVGDALCVLRGVVTPGPLACT